MDELESKFIPLQEVIELESNSKEHDLGSIHSSVERFGFLERIIINKRTGKLIAGHGRVHTIQQVKESGDDAPKGIKVENGNWLIPADYVDVDEDDEVAASIALNKLVELGGWNEPKLVDNLIAIAGEDGSGLKGTGFDGDDLDKLIELTGHGMTWGDAFDRFPDGDRAPFQQMTFTLHDEQVEKVNEAIRISKGMGEFVNTNNENSNGNALARICEVFISGTG